MFSASLIPCLISLLCFPIIIYHKEIGKSTGLLDLPNERKKHLKPIPKIGGIYILVSTIITTFYFSNLFNDRLILSYLLLISGLFLIGFIDDKIDINPTSRLLLQFIVIAIAISIDFNLNVESLKIGTIAKEIKIFNGSNLFTIFCIIALVNATNLVDGKDGLLISIFIFFLIIFFIFIKNIFNIILFNLIITSLLFLIYNIKGKVFLGNSGSYLVGGIMAFITIQSYNYYVFEIEIIFSIFYLFGLDMLRVYLERVYRGINPLTPENNHLHHYIFSYFKNKYISLLVYIFLIGTPYLVQVLYKNYLFILIFCCLIYLTSFLFFKKAKNLSE